MNTVRNARRLEPDCLNGGRVVSPFWSLANGSSGPVGACDNDVFASFSEGHTAV